MYNDLENLSLELNGITENLMLISDQFGKSNEPCRWSNKTISETLFSVAKHLERIGDDLDKHARYDDFDFDVDLPGDGEPWSEEDANTKSEINYSESGEVVSEKTKTEFVFPAKSDVLKESGL